MRATSCRHFSPPTSCSKSSGWNAASRSRIWSIVAAAIERDPAMHEIADTTADVELSEPEVLAKGFRDYVRYTVKLRGRKPLTQKRDVILGGKVVALLPVDLARNEIVL